MRRNLTLLFIGIQMLGASAFGTVKIDDLRFTKLNEKEGRIEILLDTPFPGSPEIFVKDKILQLSMPDTTVWPKIEKAVSVSEKLDTKLLAYQYDKGLVRVRAVLPFELNGVEAKVSLSLQNNKVLVNFPLKNQFVASKKSADKETFDESYLDQLIKEKEEVKAVKVEEKNEDKVVTKSSSVEKVVTPSKKEFSLLPYVGKFAAFLSLMLLAIFVVVNLMRKGFLKKSRLGFLGQTKIVEVLGTTYIAPKRSLMLVRAHKQIFLLGSSEHGLRLISELTDTAGLMKQGEFEISGENFDSGLENSEEKEFLIKENIAESRPLNPEQQKLSDQIKKKIKGLKPLQ